MSTGHPIPRAVQVRALNTLSSKTVRDWQEAYERIGTCVQQSPAYARAVGGEVVVATGHEVVAAFSVGSLRCTALGGDEPLLGAKDPTALVTVLTAVRQVAGRPVYAPLVDERYSEVAGHAEFDSWQRPPNSLIDWTDQGLDLCKRARARGSSQMDRKRRMIERDELVLDTGTIGDTAAHDVLAVDDRSWKAAIGEGMRQRGNQATLYSSLIREGVLGVAFLRNDGKPVAFRLDGRTRDRLTCLKWSYDEEYRRYSPGLHLLTDGLTRQWAHRGLRVVDLFGGPDALKDLLYTHRVPRIDVWCGDVEQGLVLAHERHQLDAKVRQSRNDGKGLRHAFR